MKISQLAPLAVMLAGVGAYAQMPQKVAVINMQEALVSTKDGQKALADLRAKYGPRDQDFQKRTQDLQAMQEKYRKTQATLSEEVKTKMERDMEAMQRSLQRDQDDTKQDYDADSQRMLQELGGKIMQVITRYAADNQYTMVFDDSGQPNNILFASNAIDITRDIIAMYDKAAPVSPTAPTAGPKPTPATTTAAPKTPPPAAPKPTGPKP